MIKLLGFSYFYDHILIKRFYRDVQSWGGMANMQKPFINGAHHAVSLLIGSIDMIAFLCKRVGVLKG